MAEIVKQILTRPIQLADQVAKAADEASASSFKQECSDLKSKTDKLAGLLRQAARASSDLYERPTRRIIDDTEHALNKTLSLVLKCRNANGLVKRVFTIIPAAAFRKASSLLDNSIGDVSWLLRVSLAAAAGDGEDEDYLGLPPIAANEPILCLIWEQIAILSTTASQEDRSDAAATLVSLARDNDRYGKLIIEEGGVPPLLKLIKDGESDGQENAARAIGLLGRDAESVEHVMHVDVSSAFVKVLKDGPMKAQTAVAWAVSELAKNYPKCQDLFAQHNIIRFLVSHLAFETVEEHSKYSVSSTVNNKPTSFHAVVMASKNNNNENVENVDGGGHNDENTESNIRISHPLKKTPNQNHHHHHHSYYSAINTKGRESEDPETKAKMKAMAARALWYLSKGNSSICKSITESRALLCFAILLEKGREDIQYNSAMAIMEITAVAEKDAELRKSGFKPNTSAYKAIIDQILRVISKGDTQSNLLIPCIKTVGNLARTFRSTETRMIGPLVKLLEDGIGDDDVAREAAATALAKFVCIENYLQVEHSKAMISEGGAKHLIQMVYFGEAKVQKEGLVVLSYMAMHVPDSEELAKAEVLTVLEWASKQGHVTQDPMVEALLQEAKSKLELYQSTRGFR